MRHVCVDPRAKARNYRPEFAAFRSFDFIDAFHFHANRPEPLLEPLADQFFLAQSKTGLRDNPYTYEIEIFLDHLGFQKMGQINEEAVEAHRLPAIGTDNHVLFSANEILKHRQLISSARAVLLRQNPHVSDVVTDQRLCFAQQTRA